ncbi:unnamed protein product [Rotaria sp. Silwood2]|nr:unnamed protein product [Rotaria sp. Silwood2]CAF4150209.1 unnamed protein product [Rotaria sp. Silwood2]
MGSLVLYDLESFVVRHVSTQLDQMTSVAYVEKSGTNESKIDTSRLKSSFEQLPNELLLNIFQFLSLNDLHRAFYNLNLRLNTICYSQKLKLDLTRLKCAFDYYCSSQQPFASQIYSLKLCDEYDRLILVNRYIDISLFKNLRAVTIRKSSPENFDKILPKLHLLSNLSYLNLSSTLIQSPHITAALFSIRSLKRLILHSFDPILLHFTDNAICPWTKLEYLELNSCYMTNFLELLKYVGPNVKRMVISILYKRPEDPASIDPTIIDNLLCGDRGHPQIPSSAVQRCPSPELVHLFNNNHNKWINDPVIMDYNHVLEPPTLEVYTDTQPALRGKYSVEFYGKERYTTTINNTTNIDNNVTKLKMTLNDNIEQLVSANQNRTIYPKVTTVIIHSQMTRNSKENDPISSVLADLIENIVPLNSSSTFEELEQTRSKDSTSNDQVTSPFIKKGFIKFCLLTSNKTKTEVQF